MSDALRRVQRETLRVESFSEGRLCLLSLRHNVADTAGMHYTSEHELIGEIEAETPAGFRVRLIRSPIVEQRVEFTKTEAVWLL